MTGARMRPALVVGLLLGLLAVALQGVQSEDEVDRVPSEDLCRPYIEKALKDLGTGSLEQASAEVGTEVDQESHEEPSSASEEVTDDVSKQEDEAKDEKGSTEESAETVIDASKEATEEEIGVSEEGAANESEKGEEQREIESASAEVTEEERIEKMAESEEGSDQTKIKQEEDEKSDEEKSDEETKVEDEQFEEGKIDYTKSEESKDEEQSKEVTEETEVESKEEVETRQLSAEASAEEETKTEEGDDSKAEEGVESTEDQAVSAEDEKSGTEEEEEAQAESAEVKDDDKEKESVEDIADFESVEEKTKSEEEETVRSLDEESKSAEEKAGSVEEEAKSAEEEAKSAEEEETTKSEEEEGRSEDKDIKSEEEQDEVKSRNKREIGEEGESTDESTEEAASEEELTPEEDLIQEIEIPENLRPRDHINQLLKLDEENAEKERAIQREADIILRDLKRLYDNAIKPLETTYKYRDLSNRHFGDPEIFSKPLVLFMGPWSGGKSSIINYLLDIEYKSMSLRTGAEPSPAYFNIIMHGEEEEVLDGTQLAADWTFSGLQKFGQGLLDRLKGLRLNNKLLEKVNIVEIPGILEIRKQVQRLFPFNDACQWFIDRADIIFLVYDPAKLDVGPETEAILDQLKGREYQTRIILNKADQVKPEELMRVQGALIWNISPLMSSAEPPIMYSTSLWSLPYEAGAPTRLLYAQERAFLRDLRSAINKRVEHKIASARRFAVRVRNHAKMVDCYLTTYYNHKTFFGNKREISDRIIENPQDYHIYEGLSTLTNISRYDLPDPDVYRDFFRLNPLYDFPLLSSTCTYFRGCPINRLDVAIAYDLPELVGKYKKSVEAVLHESESNSPPS
ncbi:hypothetical protein HN011_006712 [Eciton burchellii]|nr:hypothetical protein HN011_006712 [Eciton burchellii]